MFTRVNSTCLCMCVNEQTAGATQTVVPKEMVTYDMCNVCVLTWAQLFARNVNLQINKNLEF